MPLFRIRLLCPYSPVEHFFELYREAPSREEARRLIIGQTVTCPYDLLKFKVEDHDIAAVWQEPPPIPAPPYKVAPLEEAPEWLLSAEVIDADKPLPKGAVPASRPYLKEVRSIRNLDYYIFWQDVRSPDYPEYTFHIQFSRSVFRKFAEEAKRMAKEHKTKEAVLYLLEHEPNLTAFHVMAILGITHGTAYKTLAELAGAEPALVEELLKEVRETATLERWIPTVQKATEDEIRAALRQPPKITIYPKKHRGYTVFAPLRYKTTEELLKELKEITALERWLEHATPSEAVKIREIQRRERRPTPEETAKLDLWKPTPAEWEEIKKDLHKWMNERNRERLTYYV